MRSRAGWQPPRQGVSLFVPSTHVSVDDADSSLSESSSLDNVSPNLRLSSESNAVMKTCEHDTVLKIERGSVEPSGFTSFRADSPSTVVGHHDEEMLFDVSPIIMSTPASSPNEDLFTQLRSAASDRSPEFGTNSLRNTVNDDADMATDASLDFCYDTDRTDFRESPSPSIRKSKQPLKRTTGRTSRQFKPSRISAKNVPVRRLVLPHPDKVLKKVPKKRAKTARELLKDIENRPRNKWDDYERCLLTVLYRWYSDEDPDTIPKLFNYITGLNLNYKAISGQFKGDMCPMGPLFYPVLDTVFSIPFDDPQGCSSEIRGLIEEQAAAINLTLHARDIEKDWDLGSLLRKNSPRGKEAYRKVERRVQEEMLAAAQSANDQEEEVAIRAHGSIAAAMRISREDFSEMYIDAENMDTGAEEIITDNTREVDIGHTEEVPLLSFSSPSNPFMTSEVPALGFRIWDQDSRAHFSEDGGFMTEWFGGTAWKGPPVEPFKPEGEGLKAIRMFTTLHMSMECKSPSPFASLSTSLLQVLVKASGKSNPRIALIDLRHPSMRQYYKVLHVSKVLPWLKARGQAQWARYQGHAEWICWANIPREAIIHHFSLSEVVVLAQRDSECAELLSLDAFHLGNATKAVATYLKGRNLKLNTAIARSLGVVAKTFGLARQSAKLDHLADFIARLVDGWGITEPQAINIHVRSSLAATFATAFGPHARGSNLQEVMVAFLEGVDQGTRCIADWSRSDSGSRRQRFRDA